MSFFTNELKKIFSDDALVSEPAFVGQTCYGYLGQDLRVRAEFVAPRIVDHYDALKISILNRTNGVVDTISLKLRDVWGTKAVPNNPNFRDGVNPHIWVYNGKADWYAYHPTSTDYKVLRNTVKTYLDMFRPRENEREASSFDDRIQSAQSRGANSPATRVSTGFEPNR